MQTKNSSILITLVSVSLFGVDETAAQRVTEKFETFVVPSASAVNLGTLTLNSTTVALNQGPGLVAHGCVYSCNAGTLQWNDTGWFGRTSRDIVSNQAVDGIMNVDYAVPQTKVDFTLDAYTGFADTADITAFDASNAVVASISSLALPGGAPVPVSFSVPGIVRIVIDGGRTFSPLLDDHEYNPGPLLSLVGQCGAPGSGVSATNLTPLGLTVFLVSTSKSSTGLPINSGACGIVSLGLDLPLFLLSLTVADPTDTASILPPGGIPAAGCGLHLQVFDDGSCTLTNVLTL